MSLRRLPEYPLFSPFFRHRRNFRPGGQHGNGESSQRRRAPNNCHQQTHRYCPNDNYHRERRPGRPCDQRRAQGESTLSCGTAAICFLPCGPGYQPVDLGSDLHEFFRIRKAPLIRNSIVSGRGIMEVYQKCWD